jgi:hypothetical protein
MAKSTNKSTPPKPQPQKVRVFEIRPYWERRTLHQMVDNTFDAERLSWKANCDFIIIKMPKGLDHNTGTPRYKTYTILLPSEPIVTPQNPNPDNTPGPRTNKLGAINKEYTLAEIHKALRDHEGYKQFFYLWEVPEEQLKTEEVRMGKQLKEEQREVHTRMQPTRGFTDKQSPHADIPDAPTVDEEEEELEEVE